MNQFNEVTDQECLLVGRSVLLLATKRAIALMQLQADALESQLAAPPVPAVNGNGAIKPSMQRTMALIEEAEIVPPLKKKAKRKGTGSKNWWAQFTPEERQREMKRRLRVGRKRKKAAGLL